VSLSNVYQPVYGPLYAPRSVYQPVYGTVYVPYGSGLVSWDTEAPPQARWVTGGPVPRWQAGEPATRWVTGEPLSIDI
jgi:hypothetical protein